MANQIDWVSAPPPEKPRLPAGSAQPGLFQFYRPLNVRVALTGLEVWSQGDRISVEKNPSTTLNNFLEWRSRDLLPRFRHDNAQLIM